MSKLIHLFMGSALAAVPLSFIQASMGAAQDLQSFAIISGQSLTNTGPTTITGNIAVSPGTSFTGSGSVSQTGATFLADAVALRAQNDLTTLYTALAGRPTSSGGNLTGQDLGGMVLTAGVYNFDSSAGLATGQSLTLDAGGNPNAVFIFNIGSTLIAGSGSSVVLQNGAQGGNVFFRVGSSATLSTSATLEGQIVALTSISLNTSAQITCGAAFARNGSVTLDTNTIGICTLSAAGYDADNPTLTPNERAISKTLSDFVAGGGVLPIGIAILAATQTPDELAASLSQMTGEVATGIAPMGIQSMNAFLDTVIRPQPSRPATPPRDQGLPMGMVRDDINHPYSAKYGTQEAPPAPAAPKATAWDVWASGYGAHHVTSGDSILGSHERISDSKGLAVGVNMTPSFGNTIGLALSWNSADFSLGEFGGGSSTSVFVALRDRLSFERAYIDGTIAFGRSTVATARNVTISGPDRLVGATNATSYAANLEVGYHMGIFTPFAGLRAQRFTTQAFSETAESGSASYALQYDENRVTSLRSELGVNILLDAGSHHSGARHAGRFEPNAPIINLRAAWAHEFEGEEFGNRSFLTLPDVAFSASGATRDRDSILLAGSISLIAQNGFHVDAGVNTQFSNNFRDLGGSVTVGYQW